jgi:hypothetical protein
MYLRNLAEEIRQALLPIFVQEGRSLYGVLPTRSSVFQATLLIAHFDRASIRSRRKLRKSAMNREPEGAPPLIPFLEERVGERRPFARLVTHRTHPEWPSLAE